MCTAAIALHTLFKICAGNTKGITRNIIIPGIAAREHWQNWQGTDHGKGTDWHCNGVGHVAMSRGRAKKCIGGSSWRLAQGKWLPGRGGMANKLCGVGWGVEVVPREGLG